MLVDRHAALEAEKRHLRQVRIKQARNLANIAAKKVRDRVRNTRDSLIKEAEEEVFKQLIAKQAQTIEMAAESVEKIYEQEVGKGYEEAENVQMQIQETKRVEKVKQRINLKKSSVRYNQAKEKLEKDKIEMAKPELYKRLAKKSALEAEAERTKTVLSRPPPKDKMEIEKVAAELEETQSKRKLGYNSIIVYLSNFIKF